MSDTERWSIKTIDSCGVSPPPSSIPTRTLLPLTYLDIPWLLCRPMKRVFFYDFPHSTQHFIQTAVPSLKRSLSLSLQEFYPFAACIVDPPPPAKPHILYSDGGSVPFTAAVSAANFEEVTGNGPQDAGLLHPLVPPLPPPRVSDGIRRFPVSAIQVTLFPNTGICIGIQFLHAAADGLSFNHFIKSWASICNKGGDFTCLDKHTHSLPFHDRSVIKDTKNLEPIFLDEWWNWASTWEEPINPSPVAKNIRATFILNKSQIDRLKSWLNNHLTDLESPNLYNMSTFVVTCAFTWVCLVQSKKLGTTESDESSKLDHFCFVADCRNRLAIPETYFGNCLAICFVSVEKDTLRSKQRGIVEAAKTIARKVKELDEAAGALREAERWMVEWKKVSEVGDLVTVAGSPRLRVYDTDFGWGKPRASRVVQIDESGAIALSESREECGGVEIGLALSMGDMDAFSLVFENGLRDILGGN